MKKQRLYFYLSNGINCLPDYCGKECQTEEDVKAEAERIWDTKKHFADHPDRHVSVVDATGYVFGLYSFE